MVLRLWREVFRALELVTPALTGASHEWLRDQV